MREAQAVLDEPRRPSPVDLLSKAAGAVHGPAAVEEKLSWMAEAVRQMTSSSIGAYVGFPTDGVRATAVSVALSYDIDTFVRPALARLLPRGRPPRVLHGSDLRLDRLWRAFCDRAGLPHSAGALAVPVRSSESPAHGMLLVCHPAADHYDLEDEAAMQALADHLGVALDNTQRMTRLAELQELQRAVVHQLQEAVRPPMPAVVAAELGVHHLTADSSEPTGGDLHDWLVLPDGDVFLAVVDVMGKGVAATKEAVAVTHALRLLVLDGCPIDRLVQRADALLTAHDPDLVATVVVARYRPADGRVWLAGGGHPPPLVVSADGSVRLVSAPGVALGWPGAGSSEVVELTLERNDTLVLYTDGLIESTKDVLAGLENLRRAASEIARYPSHHVARALVERSLSGAMRRDDALALVLRRRTPPPPDAAAPLAPFEYRFSPIAATIPLGRHLLADWLEHLSVAQGEREDLLLVASELCSNAVRHASGAPSALSLRAWVEDDAIVVEVEDDGCGFEPHLLYDDELPDLEAETGRGLYVVEALSDEIAVSRIDDRTVVRATRRSVVPRR